MTQDYNQAYSFIGALCGVDTIIDARAIHDKDAGAKAQNFRGTIAELWHTLCEWNNAGYGIFTMVNASDGIGRKLDNIASCRVALLDLDGVSAPADYSRAVQQIPAPAFAVESSPSKYHVYWSVNPYNDAARYSSIQRKLRTKFSGDPKISDPTRVMRVPGFYHLKDEPYLTHCWSTGGARVDISALESALSDIVVIDTNSGDRKPLGDPDLAAPSLEWVKYAFDCVDPNNLDRAEWIALTAAVKQSMWTLATADEAFALWSQWCARYENNNPAENFKQWNDIKDTQLGWRSILARVPSIKATMALSGFKPEMPASGDAAAGDVLPMPAPPALDCSGEILTDMEQREYFKGCVLIESQAEILAPNGRYLNATKFNAKYGGKQFIITSTGKHTDEAWKAATRSTLYNVPRVDHTRFLPDKLFGEIIRDQLNRPGVNTYIPINIRAIPGDVSPFLRHMELMLPVESDRRILYEYLAHSVKYPGEKIPWAPMIQSAEGVGKGFLGETMETIIGEMYCYRPKANELVKSGSTFNAWMRAKLFIIVDEIRVDEKRELIEILKPMVSEKRIEVQSKGIDQEMEDCPAQWMFFSNFKDAIPVNKNGRRYAIFYSAIQSAHDLMIRQMGDHYFNALFTWLRADGAAHVAHWMLNYPIERGAIPMRAPDTSSTPEAQRISRGPVERVIAEAIEDALPGFRGGWLSSISIARRIKDTGAVRGSSVTLATIETIAGSMGYTALGRAPRAYFAENPGGTVGERGYLFANPARIAAGADPAAYGTAQGWD